MNHEVMPVGTREAMGEIAQFLRAIEAIHIEASNVAASVPQQHAAKGRARLYGKAAERLEALLDQPSVERRGA